MTASGPNTHAHVWYTYTPIGYTQRNASFLRSTEERIISLCDQSSDHSDYTKSCNWTDTIQTYPSGLLDLF